MAVVYTSTGFNAAFEYKRRKIAYPFRNDPTLGSLITRFYEVQEASFSAPAFDSVDAEFANAYCTGVKDRDHRDGEIMKYEVEFATIPASRSEDVEGTSARFPGFGVVATASAAQGVSGFVPAFNHQSAILHVPAHGYTAQTVLGYHLVLAVGGREFSLQGHTLVTQSSVNMLTTNIALSIPIGTPVSFLAGTVRNYSVAFPQRAALTVPVKVRARYDYFLAGVSSHIASPLDIPCPDQFRIFDSAGNETETLSTTTHPTQAQYEAMVVGRQEILIGVQPPTRWRGNIFERVLRFVRAQ
jgi:hypothetical protein